MSRLLENKKVRLNYEIMEEFEAGIELLGHEVKSLRNKRGSLEGAYVKIDPRGAWLVGLHIPPYQAANTRDDYDTRRTRRLLMNKKEIETLVGAGGRGGLTIVPLNVYTRGRNIKIGIALVRGKKKHDKRQSIKKRDTERDIRRDFKKHFNI